MRTIIRAAISSLLLALLSGTLTAQQTGEIRGKIKEEKGEALPGVAITASSPSLQGLRTAVSDRSGNFLFPLLPVGTYSLTFELPGFEKLTISGQDVRLGFTASLSVMLKPTTVRAEVTVVAPNPPIDKTKADTSYRLDSGELALVPIQARTIAEIVALTPGVTGVRMNTVSGGAISSTLGAETGLPSFRGEGDAGNNWLVDGLSTKGVNRNDPGVRLNYDAWEEVQIISDGFAPELGQGLGGFVNIVTKSGGNEFHGELGGLLQGSGLRAQRQEQLSVVSVPDTSLQQYFGNLGGPIIKDKLWFFLSDNFFGNHDKSQEQSIGWLTVPPGDRRISTNNVFGKITFTPYKNHTLSLSGTLDKFLHQSGGIGVPETYTKTDYTRYSYRLNYRGILSPNTLLTAVWGQNRNDTDTQPLSGNYGPPAYSWLDINQMTNNVNVLWASRALERRTDLAIALTHHVDLARWGNHEIKAGWSYYGNKYAQTFHFTGLDFDLWPGNGFDSGGWITWESPGVPQSLFEYGGSGDLKDTTRGFGCYAEDNFVLGRFSFMLGLRTDTQQIFNDVGEKVWSWGVGDFLQPRASVAIDLTGNGRNVLKFGYGMYSMPISTGSLWFFNRQSPHPARVYIWGGPENPTASQLEEPGNWSFIFESSTTATPEEVDPGMKPNKLNKFLLEFDRQLGVNWALKIRGIYSNSHNLMEDVGLYDPGTPSELKYLFTNFELNKRDYRAFEAELNGRIPGLLMLNASYTWSRAKGTRSGNSLSPLTWSSVGYDGYDISVFGDRPLMPEGAANKALYDQIFAGLGGPGIGDEGWYGFLPYSVDHLIKLSGTCFVPYGFNVSINIEYLSGYHWEKKGFNEAYQAYVTFPEGRGGRTTPPHMYMDLAVEKDVRLRTGLVLGLGINVYNTLNSQRPVSFVQEDNPLFGQVWARQLPRWMQIKATLKF